MWSFTCLCAQQAMFECYPSFSEEYENTTSHVGLPWRRDEAEPWDWTMIGVHYPPPGIFELISPEDPLTTTVARMEELEQAGFIDIATRVVYLDAVYVACVSVVAPCASE